MGYCADTKVAQQCRVLTLSKGGSLKYVHMRAVMTGECVGAHSPHGPVRHANGLAVLVHVVVPHLVAHSAAVLPLLRQLLFHIRRAAVSLREHRGQALTHCYMVLCEDTQTTMKGLV